MKRVITTLLAVFMLITMTVPTWADGESFDWDALEDNYYNGTSPFMSNGKALARSDITNLDNRVDYSIVVEQFALKYSMLSVKGKEDKEEFISGYKSGKSLWSMSESTGDFYAPFNDEEGLGTAFIAEDGTFGQAFLGDGGKSYKLTFTKALKNGLSKSDLKPADTKVYNLVIYDICGGILFTDGTAEYYYVQDSSFESVKKNTLYAAADLVRAIRNDKTIAARPAMITTYDEDGNPIPPETGGPGAVEETQNGVNASGVVIIVCVTLLLAAGIALFLIHRRTKRQR